MDASAYLTRHGWTGGGLGYQQAGIKKPILASQKHGFQNKGLGGKPLGGHSDQWWLGAFDAGLKNLGSEKPVGTPLPVGRGPAYFKAELYRNFKQGEGLTGTITKEMARMLKAQDAQKSRESKHRKSEVETPTKLKDEERQRKAMKKKGNEDRDSPASHDSDDSDLERRRERRHRKAERRARKEERRREKMAKQGDGKRTSSSSYAS